MKKLQIVTDSTSHIPEALRRELDIHVVPLPLVWEGRTVLDNEVDPHEFFSQLREARMLPTTSGPTPGSFKEAFEKLASSGRRILAIVLGRFLSSTFNAASLARDMRSGMDITVFNAGMTSMALGFQVLAAARAARAGRDVADVVALLTRLQETTGAVFAVEDLRYMVRGGRISHLQRLIASVLDLTPILELQMGRIRLVERVRRERNVTPRLLALVAQRASDMRPLRVAVVHADAETKARELLQAARDRLRPDEAILSEVLPVQGVHTGPGALGLAYSCGA